MQLWQKRRDSERAGVRSTLRWNEVYQVGPSRSGCACTRKLAILTREYARQPHRSDRVAANLSARDYVPPDAKRRDDVRWEARVMMHS